MSDKKRIEQLEMAVSILWDVVKQNNFKMYSADHRFMEEIYKKNLFE